MKILKKILLVLFILFIGIQFIRPARNVGGQGLPADITRTVPIPDKVADIFKNACNDCHSNNTRYPWYVNIEPAGWMLANHIKEGKENLNLSEFGAYSKRKQANKLRAIAKSINEGTMPISSYTIMHTDAKLSTEDKKLITDWVTAVKDSMDAKN